MHFNLGALATSPARRTASSHVWYLLRRAGDVSWNLYRELGVIETVRFLRQYTSGYGNYTAEREALLGQKPLEELLAEIKQRRAPAAEAS